MPGIHGNGALPQLGTLCKRCNEQEAILVVRRDALCKECFLKYVSTKVIKRMDAFRVRNATPGKPRQLLLPVSMGISSVCLLHLLNQMQDSQLVRINRTGFELHVVHVEESSTIPEKESKARLEKLEQRYPRHSYHWTSARAQMHHPEKTGSCADKTHSKLLASASSEADMILVSRTNAIVEIAKQHDCESILWGDTTTKLAAKILAETAKGRGFSLPWQASDGPSPFGVEFMFPMREMLKKELEEYIHFVEPPLTDLIEATKSVSAPVSTKNNTIDGLMKEYFEGVEQNFPSIVANVVRTSAKLEAPHSGTRGCTFCKMPVSEGAFGLSGWGGDQAASIAVNDLAGDRCYGCTRSLQGSTGWD